MQSWSRPSRPRVVLVVSFVSCVYLFVHLFLGLPQVAVLPHPPAVAEGGQAKWNHPIDILVTAARLKHHKSLQQQSQSLHEAVLQYKIRNNIDPPPHFDKWYEFTQKHKVPLVDEYDDINTYLRPFWGMQPAAIREQVTKAINTDAFITGVYIRSGKVTTTERGDDWRYKAVKNVVEQFAYLLPDMDLAINRHDEPRVIIPADKLKQLMVRSAQEQEKFSLTRNGWSPPPSDLHEAGPIDSVITPFFEYAHRFTWPIATISCPPDSPARMTNYDNSDSADASNAYTDPVFQFMHNRTAATDICLSSSLRYEHGFFNKPNSWTITHDPIPIFSPSKVSSFHDILFPAPWYLWDKSVYSSWWDTIWDKKKDSLFWRGSTTSGFSDGGVWHMQERQRFVESVEKPGTGHILRYLPESSEWVPEEVPRESYNHLFDVHISKVGQCSVRDCAEQQAYFDVQPEVPFEENWKNKFLLDIDGNAFSGRFYTFLQSNSLTMKQALFREWHESRVVPWVHYIPLGFNGSEHLEIMRYFTEDEEGRQLAREIAAESSEWANQSLRHVDMEAWIFRLLLEYARLIDDARNEIGYLSPQIKN